MKKTDNDVAPISNTGKVTDALPDLQAKIANGTTGVMTLVIQENGDVSIQSFGTILRRDMAWASVILASEATNG